MHMVKACTFLIRIIVFPVQAVRCVRAVDQQSRQTQSVPRFPANILSRRKNARFGMSHHRGSAAHTVVSLHD